MSENNLKQQEVEDAKLGILTKTLASIDEVTTEWLSTILSAQILSFTSSKIGTGQLSTTYRLFLSHSFPSIDSPKTLILKLAPFSSAARKSALRYGLSEREVRFYQELSPHFNLKSISKCYFSAFDNQDGRFTLLLADAGLDAKPGDDLIGATKEQATTAVREIARFHSEILRLKDELKIGEQAWLKKVPMNSAVLGLMFGGFYQRFHGKEEGLGEEDWKIVRKFVGDFDAWQDEQTKSESYDGQGMVMGLNHCDFRMDNVLFGKEGEVTIVDWQTLQIGPVVSDLAFFLAGSLKEENRREWMEELVDVYVEGVGGGVRVNREVVMRGLRERCWTGFIGSIVGAMIGERSERGDVMLLEMMRRTCVMVRDLKAMDDLPKTESALWAWVVLFTSLLGRGLELTGRWG